MEAAGQSNPGRAADRGFAGRSTGRLFAMRLSLKIEGYAERQNESRYAEHGQSRCAVRLEDDDLSRHRNQGHFEDEPNTNDIFFDVALQRLEQLDTDKDQQEVGKNIEETGHPDKEPRRLPDLFCNQECQMYGGERYNDYEQNRQGSGNKLFGLGQNGFHIVSTDAAPRATMIVTWPAENFNSVEPSQKPIIPALGSLPSHGLRI